MTDHEKYMSRCFQLAANGKGRVAPNPLVGAVLVYDGKIIGEGYHQKYGEAHAEVNCINSVTEEDRRYFSDSILYVSLEPCNHTGNTPPCTDLILRSGIQHVVVACSDPFEKVNGSGIKQLRDAGVRVDYGVLEAEAREINKLFFTFHEKQRPFIILKWAQTADGFIGTETDERLRVTDASADVLVHQWRSECAAIMVGTKTAIADNPQLNNRLFPGASPVRLVIDLNLEIPATHHLLSDGAPTIVITEKKSGAHGAIMYYQVGRNEALLPVVISLLHQRKLTSLIVEGGAETLKYFIDEGLWDEIRVITNGALTVGKGLPAPVIRGAGSVKEFDFSGHNVKVYTKQQKN